MPVVLRADRGPAQVIAEEPAALYRAAPAAAPKSEVAMATEDVNGPRQEASTVALIKEAVDEVRALLKAEIALARDEAKREIAAVKRAGIAMGVAVVAALLGLSLLLVSMVLAIGPQALNAVIPGGILLVIAGAAALFAYKSIPKKPLEHTQERLQENAQVLKEQLL